ncbi:MAG TPA: hypothetical protein VEV16_08685, partial [Daejeonella sp.]|nr:hypothetical protein [Daejeonella sp.]
MQPRKQRKAGRAVERLIRKKKSLLEYRVAVFEKKKASKIFKNKFWKSEKSFYLCNPKRAGDTESLKHETRRRDAEREI